MILMSDPDKFRIWIVGIGEESTDGEVVTVSLLLLIPFRLLMKILMSISMLFLYFRLCFYLKFV